MQINITHFFLSRLSTIHEHNSYKSVRAYDCSEVDQQASVNIVELESPSVSEQTTVCMKMLESRLCEHLQCHYDHNKLVVVECVQPLTIDVTVSK